MQLQEAGTVRDGRGFGLPGRRKPGMGILAVQCRCVPRQNQWRGCARVGGLDFSTFCSKCKCKGGSELFWPELHRLADPQGSLVEFLMVFSPCYHGNFLMSMLISNTRFWARRDRDGVYCEEHSKWRVWGVRPLRQGLISVRLVTSPRVEFSAIEFD